MSPPDAPPPSDSAEGGGQAVSKAVAGTDEDTARRVRAVIDRIERRAAERREFAARAAALHRIEGRRK
jgi:hypothetical protein